MYKKIPIIKITEATKKVLIIPDKIIADNLLFFFMAIDRDICCIIKCNTR